MRSKVVLGVGFVVVLALTCLAIALGVNFLTDYQWYASLGHEGVLLAQLGSKALVWVLAFLVAFAVLAVNTRVATGIVSMRGAAAKVAFGGVAVLAALSALTLAGDWMTLRLAIEQVPFNATDPQFGKDIGFFVFTLPALERLGIWANGLVALALIVVIAIVAVPTRPGVTDGLAGRWTRLKPVVAVLGGFMMLWVGFNYWVKTWQLAASTRGAFTGAFYTDVHALVPAYRVLALLSVSVAIVLFATARSRRWWPALSSLAVWAVIAIALTGVWPALVQRYSVDPNEAARELSYLEHNIAMTREAFDLTPVRGTPFSIAETLSPEAAGRAARALEKARIWTPRTVQQAYDELQTVRPYYRLSPIDTDRYTVGAEPQQVLVTAREIETSRLPKNARTWVNLHLVYTHGYGIVIGSTSTASEGGMPTFLVGDVPPVTHASVATDSPELDVTQPRIYYGPRATDYAVVNTGIEEFDYPAGERNVTCGYQGTGGVRVGSFANRIAWALRLGSSDLLFSDYVDQDSLILTGRDIATRVRRLAPWLDYDENAYPALVDGRIVWLLDAYTSSDHYPYAQPLADGTNYLRNSVKVTVDALTGQTTFYAWGDDPIRDAWSGIFPGVVTPQSEMKPSLAAHVRYPKRLFSAQAQTYRTYHMTDATVLYNREDQWQVPGAAGDAETGPTYLMVDLPDGATGPAFHLMQPYAPAGRGNLIGWMAVGCDPDDYGDQTVYLLPKDRVVLGATQVRARIEQDPVVSPQLSLWDQRGSRVLLGDMLEVPLEGAIAYVQPVFLQASDRAITELAAVVVVEGERVRMAPTLEGALEAVFAPPSAEDTSTSGSGLP